MLSCRCSQLRERSHFFNIRESILVVSNKLKWHPLDAKRCAKLLKIIEIRKYMLINARNFFNFLHMWINFCNFAGDFE